jgi:hypothetical protein
MAVVELDSDMAGDVLNIGNFHFLYSGCVNDGVQNAGRKTLSQEIIIHLSFYKLMI